MFSPRMLRAILTSTAITGSFLASHALAQSQAPYKNVDANGVDLTDGSFNFDLLEGSIGSGKGQMSLVSYIDGTSNWPQVYLDQSKSGSTYTVIVQLGATSDVFVGTSTTLTSSRATGATLSFTLGGNYLYRYPDGRLITFRNTVAVTGPSNFCTSITTVNCSVLASTIESPDGSKVTYTWDIHKTCVPVIGGSCVIDRRLNKVSNNAGYAISFAYVSNTFTNGSTAWFDRASAQFSNANVGTAPWPTVTYSYPSAGVRTVTTPQGSVWRITKSGSTIGIKRPAASTDTTTATIGANGVTSVTRDGITTSYNRTVSGSTATTVVTDALSNQTTIVADMNLYRPTSVTDALGHVTTYSYDGVGRLTEIVDPELDKQQFSYDARGNATTVTRKAKPGSGLADIVTNAGYDATCANVVTCNSPNSTQDALGNQTDYTYDSTTGQVLTVTAPAAASGGTRPKTTYSYSTVSGVAMPTGVSTCQTGSSCVGTSDEVKTTVAYDSNLNPTSVSKGAGDGSLTATTAATYDAIGNVLTVDGPLSGSADTTTFRYDADRRRLGVISPDPDGAASLKRRAVKTTYNADGQVTVSELGTVNGTSDPDWAAFSSQQQMTATYDANAFKITDVLTGSSTTYSVSQYSYDADGRSECTALRMNSAAWGSLPGSACTLGTTGSGGPDRITKAVYDAVGRTTKTTSAYGTSDASDDATATYTANGQIATLTDAEGNKTTYEYDGFDRQLKTRYPDTTKGAGTSSTTDYEQLSYDANGNITSRRLRDGTSIGFNYDNLNRMTLQDLSGSGIDLDISYTYDLLGRMLTSSNPVGHLTYYAYDALSRVTSELTTYGGSKLSTYDAAGRRTRLTWPDGFYVDYDYDVTGNMIAVRENGATSGVGILATYGYDDLGRRTSLTRGNGVVTSYGYDAVSRLSSLASDLAGTTNDVTTSFSYNAASQIASSTRSNDAYAWTGAANAAAGYTSNGLNQYSAAGSTSLGYDARGNLNNVGGTSYGYSQRNQLYSGASLALAYDPPGRLDYLDDNTTARTFDYDGDRLATEGNWGSSTVVRRYVFGANTDEPLVWYEGSGTSDRRWLVADERGSIVAVTDASGAATAINTYDEYGKPGSGNLGRFQYTGQAWIPELGMYYYKARMYAPGLGRFMQTDPIGYSDGMNWYSYVDGDPVNGVDSTGLDTATNPCADLQGADAVVCGISHLGGNPGWLTNSKNDCSLGAGCESYSPEQFYNQLTASTFKPSLRDGDNDIIVTASKLTPNKQKTPTFGEELCRNTVSTLGAPPESVIVDSVVGYALTDKLSQLGSGLMFRYLQRNVGEIGSVIEAGGSELNAAKAGARLGPIGAIGAGLAAYYFRGPIESALKKIC